MVASVRILDVDTTQLATTIGGVEWSGIRCHLENGAIVIDGDGEIPDAVREWLATGGVPEPYIPSTPTADDVRGEASRRMIALVGARDANHLQIILANASREAIRLLRKGPENWSTEEAARAAALEAADAAIEHIRARSNAMEPNPPLNYAEDINWI